MRVHITGIAGFIGFHVARELMDRGHEVSGSDMLTDYYDVRLKVSRIKELNISLIPLNNCDVVLHLAAQPGVMFSRDNPETYIDNNIREFINVLEYCRHAHIPLVYASSSTSIVAKSIYGATKAFDEIAARVYRDNYGMNILGLRFYSVYGPWGRPDMAYWKWTEQILAGDTITIRGRYTRRDFSYIGDVAPAICDVLESGPYESEIIDIGRGKPRLLDEVVDVLEGSLGISVPRIYTELNKEEEETNETFNPQCTMDIEEGIPKFVEWYLNYMRK